MKKNPADFSYCTLELCLNHSNIKIFYLTFNLPFSTSKSKEKRQKGGGEKNTSTQTGTEANFYLLLCSKNHLLLDPDAIFDYKWCLLSKKDPVLRSCPSKNMCYQLGLCKLLCATRNNVRVYKHRQVTFKQKSPLTLRGVG